MTRRLRASSGTTSTGSRLTPRCIQIAGFAVAMEAWKAGFPTDEYLPLPNLACVGLPIRAEKEEWLKLAAGDGLLEGELEKYYDLFKNADSLGSLIQIEESNRLIPGEVLMRKLEAALAKEKAIGDPVAEAFGETASGVLKAVQYLRRRDFHIVVTNPPFLARGAHSSVIQKYCDLLYNNEKIDLATCFLKRIKIFTEKKCIYGLVSPQNWLFLGRYAKMRSSLLRDQALLTIGRLGPRAFESISGEIVKVILCIVQNIASDASSNILFIDAANELTAPTKAYAIRAGKGKHLLQNKNLYSPDYRIILDEIEGDTLLNSIAKTGTGLQTYDTARFILNFWELSKVSPDWLYMQNSPKKGNPFSDCSQILHWENGEGALSKMMMQFKEKGYSSGIWRAGSQFWGREGILVGLMSEISCSFYMGGPFNVNTGVLIPNDITDLPVLWAFCSSPEFNKAVRAIDQTLKVTNATLVKVPFDLAHWQKVAEEQYPNGLPEPHSDDPTQWLFKGNIVSSEQPLQVAIARMLGYHWPEQPAGEDPLDALIDKDGIVCIPPVWGERPAAESLRSILATAYGSEWSPRKEEELLKQVGYTKNGGLERFLRDEFFASHCKLFHHRPFIWQVWDGTKDGFSVLLNYHKLDRKTLEKLIYTYLGTWITQQKDEVRQEKAGAERRLAAAEALKAKLEQILEGETPFDIYVRWKPLHEQAMGWEPDLNDGVRMNIRPFMEAGVLRWKPNIKWGKDRGTDPVPNCSGTTERLNDLHFTLEEKQKARETAR